jgi:DNA helicase-2/ATP-dependent DNA helicase PcrA
MNRRELCDLLGFPPSDEQWAAITAPLSGPFLVLAGAGSGKTAVMSARVLWLVATGQVAADQVLGLTFTNKAGGELGARIRSLLARAQMPGMPQAPDPTIQTYHAFAMDLIAQYGLLIGAEPASVLLNPTDLAVSTYRSVARSAVACEELGTAVINTVQERVQSLDEQLSEHLVTPAQLRDFDARLAQQLAGEAGKPSQEAREACRRRIVASQVVEEVRRDRAADHVLSFADLMRFAVRVSEQPTAVEQMRLRFSVVLVDEYQDTSVAQANLLQNLFGDGFPLTAVGDPLQAIYGWRGASVANIDGFPDRFGAATRTLTINRRSGSLILDAANAVAADVRSQHPGVAPLRPGTEQAGEVVAGCFASFADEVRWLVDNVQAQIDNGRCPDEIAVLCRTNEYVRLIADTLRAAGIPTAAASLGSVLHLPEVVEVLSFLRVLHSGNNAAVVRLLTGPQWRLGPTDMAQLGARARSFIERGDDAGDFRKQLSQAVAHVDPVDVVNLLEAVYDPGGQVSEEARLRLRQFTAQLDVIRPALAAGVEEAAHRIVEVTGLGVEVRLGRNAASRIDGLAALFDVIATYRGAHDDPSVGAFLQWLDFAEQLDETPDTDFPIRGTAVRVMSVHRAKGLEWECVFVPTLTAGIFPSGQGRLLWTKNYRELPYPLRGDSSRLPLLPDWTRTGGSFPKAVTQLKSQYKEQDLHEENRLAYVALTRARDVLYASGHWWAARNQEREPSQYLRILRNVPGVRVATWVGEQPPKPANLSGADVPWPGAAEVYTDVSPPEPTDEPLTLEESAVLDRLDADIDAVFRRELEQSRPTSEVDLPSVLSASLLMRAVNDPVVLARDLARPMPYITGEAARRGTAFHEWIAASHQQLSLIPEWDVAADADLAPDDDLAEFIAGYRRTPYATLVPYAVETEVAVSLAGTVVRGVIDAVFQHPDGRWEVVDWKTNRAHTADPLQLAVYRIAWAEAVGVQAHEVATAFVYVRDGDVVRPAMPSRAELEATVRAYKENAQVTAQ